MVPRRESPTSAPLPRGWAPRIGQCMLDKRIWPLSKAAHKHPRGQAGRTRSKPGWRSVSTLDTSTYGTNWRRLR